MGKASRAKHTRRHQQKSEPPGLVDSLLDLMKPDKEYQSILGKTLRSGDVDSELRRALADLEAIRGRPCLCYFGNTTRSSKRGGIGQFDRLPFKEMVDCVEPGVDEVDLIVSTNGGLAEQVREFVDALRPRFDNVEFIIPDKAMSAGTLWALSGDRIWMDRRASIGPIDPQVMGRHGRMMPAQALKALVDKIEKEAQKAKEKRTGLPWTYVALMRAVDPNEYGMVQSASEYIENMATEFLERYKLKDWTRTETNGLDVNPVKRRQRAWEIAKDLSSHDRWKKHGHAINRTVVMDELRLKIDHPEDVEGFERALRRLWALVYYTFERTNTVKLFMSSKYFLVFNEQK